MLTQEYLQECFNYCHKAGSLIWKSRPESHFNSFQAYRSWNGRFLGTEAGTLDFFGYVTVSVVNKRYKAHRLIWLLVHGEIVTEEIDHINGNRSDNRVCNLRHVSRSENGRNTKRPSTNKSGVIGVYFDKERGRWRSQIADKGKNIALGCFMDVESAIKARLKAEIEYGYHKNHGRD